MADDSYEFDALPAERQKLLLDWIRHNLKPIKSINQKSGSGTLKAFGAACARPKLVFYQRRIQGCNAKGWLSD